MKILLTVSALFVFVFFSCQKEIADDLPTRVVNDSTTTNSSDTLLVKIIEKNAQDSFYTLFFYDSSNRLKFINSGTFGDPDTALEKFTWLADGRLKSYLYYDTPDDTAFNKEEFFYDANGSLKYALELEYYNAQLPPYRGDSLAYTYVGTNRTEFTLYSFSFGIAPWKEMEKLIFQKDANGNVTHGEIYSLAPGTYTLSETADFTYDNKKRVYPYSFNELEAMYFAVFGLPEQTQKNNPLKRITSLQGSPPQLYFESSYIYDSYGKPIIEKQSQPGSSDTTYFYYYYNK